MAQAIIGVSAWHHLFWRLLQRIFNMSITNCPTYHEHKGDFSKYRSCLTNHLPTKKRLTKSIGEGDYVGHIFVDFVRSFDAVTCWVLSSKLQIYTLNPKVP